MSNHHEPIEEPRRLLAAIAREADRAERRRDAYKAAGLADAAARASARLRTLAALRSAAVAALSPTARVVDGNAVDLSAQDVVSLAETDQAAVRNGHRVEWPSATDLLDDTLEDLA
jgi:hypothetical protein